MKKVELFKITLSTGGNGFDIPFKQEIIKVDDKPGGYIISSGCGSGKTESIKSLIRQKWDEGILYCVDTIEECNKMDGWISDNLLGSSLNGTILTKNDVFVLHSNVDFENLGVYTNTPWELLKRKIIIITHIRLWTNPIALFLIYDSKASKLPDFDGDFDKLMSRNDLRKYIVIDETPIFFKDFLTIPKSYLGLFSDSLTGAYKIKTRSEIERYYNDFLKGTDTDSIKRDCTYTKYVRKLMLDFIEKRYSLWMDSLPKTKNNFSVSFSPKDLIVPNMQTHLLIYEGAGDVLLGNDSKFTLLDMKQKYNAQVSFQEFNFSLLRDKMNLDDYNTEIAGLRDRLSKLSGKTLVVVWKNEKSDDITSDDKKYFEKVKGDLLSFSNVSTTYYGASDTKSTNEYRAYENIVLFGSWNIPSVASAKIKGAYGSSTTPEQYRLWYFVQLLCRIGIRNGDGKAYNVFYSSDYGMSFINTLDQYLNSNTLCLKSGKGKALSWRDKIINRSYLYSIEQLIKYNPGSRKPLFGNRTSLPKTNLLEQAILDDTKSFSCSICLDTLDKISSKDGKKGSKLQKKTYNPLVKYLKKNHQITLNILNKREWKKRNSHRKIFRVSAKK